MTRDPLIDPDGGARRLTAKEGRHHHGSQHRKKVQDDGQTNESPHRILRLSVSLRHEQAERVDTALPIRLFSMKRPPIMKRTFLSCFAILLILPLAHGGEVEIPAAKKEKFSFKSPEQYQPLREPFTPPMFGDQFQFGFNFNGGFNFNFGSQGGFNFQFGGQFNQGGFNFGGQFNGGGFQFGAPIAPLRGAYKIAGNESPRPTDRVYFQYN